MAIVRVKVSAETSKASVSVSSQLWPAAAASCEEVIRYPCEREPRPPPTHSSHTTRLSFTTLLLLLLLQFSLHHVTVHDQPYGTAAPRLRSAAVGISGCGGSKFTAEIMHKYETVCEISSRMSVDRRSED